jgi:hypothetical protein
MNIGQPANPATHDHRKATGREEEKGKRDKYLTIEYPFFV